MRRVWINLILKTTSLITKKKQNLLTYHAFRSIFGILLIIFLELFLAIISLPLYLTSKEENVGGKVQYRIRRILTLTSLIFILIVWFIKLAFIVVTPLYVDTSQFYIFSETQDQAQVDYEERILPEIYGADIDEHLDPPLLIDLRKTKHDSLLITGEGDKNTQAIISISIVLTDELPGDTGVKVYVADVDENGKWSIETGINKFDLLPGRYKLEVMAYNENIQKRSNTGQVDYFEIPQDWQSSVLSSFDLYLNIVIMGFLTLGVVSIVLLI